MANFVENSPELNTVIKSITSKANGLSSDKLIRIPGGISPIKQLLKGNNTLNNRILDAIGGAGQYKLPQRLTGAAIGGLLLGDEDNPVSAAGAIGGYGASAITDKAIRELRGAEVSKGLSGLESAGSLERVTPKSIVDKIKQLKGSLASKDLKSAFSDNIDLHTMINNPVGYTSLEDLGNNIYEAIAKDTTGLLDDTSIANLKTRIPQEIAKLKNIPGFSRKAFKEQAAHLIDSLQDTADTFKGIGITRDSLSRSGMGVSSKLHELLELMQMTHPEKGISKEMVGGNLSKPGSLAVGVPSIAANHMSPAVVMHESNLNSRLLGGEGKALSEGLRSSTGERQFFNKILGADLDSVILSDDYIKSNADDIADILNAYKTNKMPAQELLDKVKLNKLTSILSKAGKGISSLEGGISKAIKTLLRRR